VAIDLYIEANSLASVLNKMSPNMATFYLSDLFVQIGASLRMFISFSVFTFVEIAEILIRIFVRMDL
jgi:hypothetical protein